MSICSTGLYGSATIVNSDLFNDVLYRIGLGNMVFPEYGGIRKALREVHQDARRSSRSFAKVALATPTMKRIGLWVFWVAKFCEKTS
jgi:hypothetical protein